MRQIFVAKELSGNARLLPFSTPMTILVIADDETPLPKLPDVHADVLISCGDMPDGMILSPRNDAAASTFWPQSGTTTAAELLRRRSSICTRRPTGTRGVIRRIRRLVVLQTVARWSRWEVDDALAEFPRVDVFVAHNSPRLVHDRDDDVHIGFAAFNTYLDRTHPRWLLHGHQHVNTETMVGATRVIGTYGFRFLAIPE